MTTLEKIRELCVKKGISLKSLERQLGFSNGSLAKSATIKAERLEKIADYFEVSTDYLMDRTESTDYIYYLNDETQKVAQEIFENDRVLFDVYRSSDKDRLIEYAKKLKALRDMEKGEI